MQHRGGIAVGTGLFANYGFLITENVVSVIYRIFTWIAAAVMACAVGNLPGCGTMGGGMRYLAPDPLALLIVWR